MNAPILAVFNAPRDRAMMAAAAEGMRIVIFFCLIWFAVYVLIGAFVKVYVIRRFSPVDQQHLIRFWPVFLSHVLFSVIFVNLPVIMFFSDFADQYSPWLFSFLYMFLLPIVLEILLLRVLPRVKGFKWLSWAPPWKPMLSVSFGMCLLSCIITCAAVMFIARLF